MRFGWALGLLAAATVARAEPLSLAVRVPAPAASAVTRTAALTSILAALPSPPIDARPLLASISPPAFKTGTAFAAGRGPALSHPMDAWCIVRFPTAERCESARAWLAVHRPDVLCEAVHDVAVASPPAGGAAAEIPPNVAQIHAPEALAAVTPDTTIIVAVIDTGSDLTHPDLVRRLWLNDDSPGDARLADDANDQNGDGIVEQWERDDDDDNGYVDDVHGFDFTDAPGKGAAGDAVDRDADPSDEQGHGTHVAGIVGADGSLQGVAPFVRLMTLRAAYTTPLGGGVLETDDAAAAIVYAVDNGARILNLSWGDSEESRLVRAALEYALAHGVVVVAAAGNGGRAAPHWPSSQPGVIAVGAVDATGARANFSNYGAGVTLAAPGEISSTFEGGILSLAPGGGRARLRGTSMAAPHVAGAAAIVMSRPDHPDAEAVRTLLIAGARRATRADWSAAVGHGVVDVLQSVHASADAFVEFLAPSRAYFRGRVTLLGTVLGSDIVRWRVDAAPHAGGPNVELRAWTAAAVVADTLVAMPFTVPPEGLWDVTLAAETGAGRTLSRHTAFQSDTTPPRLKSLAVASGWRSGAAHDCVTLVADEEVQARIGIAPGDTLYDADAGLTTRLQIEVPQRTGSGPWQLTLTNAAGLAFDTLATAPPGLGRWPREAQVERGDSTAAFMPEAAAGRAPDGTAVVWGRGQVADSLTTLQAWGVNSGQWTLRFDAGRQMRPVAAGDANGDGADDVLAQRSVARAGQAVWLVSRSASGFPDSLLASVPAERVLGLFQLDADAPLEALLSSDDSLFVYDDVRTLPPRRLQALVNPSRAGFNVFGADAAVGDFDADGHIEIASGDAEGHVAVWERDATGVFQVEWTADTQGTYAYDFTALATGGFLVGRQRSASVTGDGFATAPYDFIPYLPDGSGAFFVQGPPLTFLGPENDLQAGSAAARDPFDNTAWLALVRGSDLYLQRDGVHVTQLPGAGGDAPVLLDLDGDSHLDVVCRSSNGARWWRTGAAAGELADLETESLGSTRVQLRWTPNVALTSRVRRLHANVWDTLGETSTATWIDSTAVADADYSYEVEAVAGLVVQGRTNRVDVHTQALPRLVRAVQFGRESLRVTASNRFGPSALAPDAWRLEPAAGAGPHVLQAGLVGDGRDIELVLDAPLPLGTTVIRAARVRDDQKGRFRAAGAAIAIVATRPPPPFAVRGVHAEANGFAVVFGRAVDPATVLAGNFIVRRSTVQLAVATATLADSATVQLRLAPGAPLLALGAAFFVRVGAALQAADGTPLVHPELDYHVAQNGRGVAFMRVAPNPVRPQDPEEVVFADVTPQTRVRIYDVEGQLVRDLSGAADGGLRWNLRNSAGGRVASGTYVFVARDGTGVRQGRVVVAR